MANTYTQVYIHVVFAVEGRQNLIPPEHNDEFKDQHRHHGKKSFREEYVALLERFGVEYDARYIFKTEAE